MKIVDVNLVYDEKLSTTDEQLKQHYTVVGWAEALQKKGVEVHVVKRFSNGESFVRNNVSYNFINDRLPVQLSNWQIPFKVFRKVASLQPDVVVLHALSSSFQTFYLRWLLKKKTAIIIQHHGGPASKGFGKKIHDAINSVADGYFFTTLEQGIQWFGNKNQHKIFPVMEGATFFDYESRDAGKKQVYHERAKARDETHITGNPVFLWVGRLDRNKDPLTVLDGFDSLGKNHPSAKLYMIFSEDRLISGVNKKIQDSEMLKEQVHLLGKIEHEKMESYYQSADYFVLASHYEGSGYALSEALKCGCIPIVTNIPSFRMMTNEGKLGTLFEPGNKYSFVDAAKIAMSKPITDEAEACIKFFKENLSFDAIAATTIGHFEKIIARRLNRAGK
jgi:glycosyltransferase involved in cell wall biosynthesis